MLLPPGAFPAGSAENAALHAAWIGSYPLARTHLAGADDVVVAQWLEAYVTAATGEFVKAYDIASDLWPQAGWPLDAAIALTAGAALRQRRRYDDAERWDRLALGRSRTRTQRAVAMISLAADAVGRGEATLVAERLEQAAGPTDARTRIRSGWVHCELGLLSGDGAHAVHGARVALDHATTAGARRHIAKSMLFLGVALRSAGDLSWRSFVEQAQRRAANIGARGLVSAANTVLLEK